MGVELLKGFLTYLQMSCCETERAFQRSVRFHLGGSGMLYPDSITAVKSGAKASFQLHRFGRC